MCARLEIRTGRLVRARAVRAECSLAGLTNARFTYTNQVLTYAAHVAASQLNKPFQTPLTSCRCIT